MPCKFCGATIPPERTELGYDYCTAKACAKSGFKPKTVISMALPKSVFLVMGFAEDDPHAGLAEGYGARRYN